jgi:lysophospholipase L1-like esterase
VKLFSKAVRTTRSLVFFFVAAVVGLISASCQPAPPAAHPFEKDILAFEAADRANPPAPGAILFVGDSQFTRWKTLQQDLPDYRLINRGFGGSKMTDLLFYMDRIVLPYKPRMIVINEGGNDIHAGRTPEQLLANIKTFVKKVRAVMPGVPIAFSGLTSSPARITETAQRLRFNHLLKTYLAHGKKLIYLDLFNDFIGTDGMPRKELFVQDQLHDSEAGYAIRVRVVRPFLGPPDYPDRKPAQ